MATQASRPSLPQVGARVPLTDLIEEIILEVRWHDEELADDGQYSALALSLDDSDPAHASYGVVWIGCTPDDHRWGVLSDNHFGTACEAVTFYEYGADREWLAE